MSAEQNHATLPVTGELTIFTANEQKAALVSALGSADVLDIDLAEVVELDTAGLQLLLLARREATHLGKQVHLRAPSAAVLTALHVAHLNLELDHAAPGTEDADDARLVEAVR